MGNFEGLHFSVRAEPAWSPWWGWLGEQRWWGIQGKQEMADTTMIGWWNIYTELAVQEGHVNVRNIILSLWQGSHFSFLRAASSTWQLLVCPEHRAICLCNQASSTNFPDFENLPWSKFCLSRTLTWDSSRYCRSPVWPLPVRVRNIRTFQV